MPISSTVRKAGPYVGTGATRALPFTFKAFSTADLRVVWSDTSTGEELDLALGVGFTATLNADQNANPGGTVTPTAAWSSVQRITITTDIDALQPVDLTNQGGFYPSVLNTALDRLTMLMQQVLEEQARTLRVSVSDTAGGTVMAPAVSRANKILGFDASGRPAYTVPTSGSAADVALQLASLITDLATDNTSKGAAMVAQPADTAGTRADTVFNILRRQYLATRYMTTAQRASFEAGDLTVDVTTALQTALGERAGKRLMLNGKGRISGSLSVTAGTVVETEGRAVQGVVSFATNTPIFRVYGQAVALRNIGMGFATMPTALQTDAVAIRSHNCYGSQFENLDIRQVHGAIDQHQGSTPEGSYSAFFSNELNGLWITTFSGWAIKLIPWNAGNSGNSWNNVYINNRNGATPSSNLPCLGGVWIETSQNDKIDLLNLEWMKNSGALLVLNQAGNAKFGALHIEGVMPQTDYTPLVDVLSGDGSCPIFDGITLDSNDWSALGGANRGSLFRVDNAGTRLSVRSLVAKRNVSPNNMTLAVNAGSTAYGSVITVESCPFISPDTSLCTDEWTPKANFGAPASLTRYPLQRFNELTAASGALLSDNAGGTNSTVNPMPGSVPSVANDRLGLWDASGSRFIVKQPDNYVASLTIPTGSSPVVQIKRNGTVVAALTGTGSVLFPADAGDQIQFVLASGSYTRTGVYFGIGVAA